MQRNKQALHTDINHIGDVEASIYDMIDVDDIDNTDSKNYWPISRFQSILYRISSLNRLICFLNSYANHGQWEQSDCPNCNLQTGWAPSQHSVPCPQHSILFWEKFNLKAEMQCNFCYCHPHFVMILTHMNRRCCGFAPLNAGPKRQLKRSLSSHETDHQLLPLLHTAGLLLLLPSLSVLFNLLALAPKYLMRLYKGMHIHPPSSLLLAIRENKECSLSEGENAIQYFKHGRWWVPPSIQGTYL